MAKIIKFPTAKPALTQSELVDLAAIELMNEVMGTFVEQNIAHPLSDAWYRDIKAYLTIVPIIPDNNGIRSTDLRKWKNHWRGIALDYIRFYK